MEQLKIYDILLEQHEEINYNKLNEENKSRYNKNISSLKKVYKLINENLPVLNYMLIIDMIQSIKENLKYIRTHS